MALESQKSSINIELQNKIDEIKRHRVMIQKKLGAHYQKNEPMSLKNKQQKDDGVESNPSTPRTITQKVEKQDDGQTDTQLLLQRDKEYYDIEKSRMM